MQIKVLAKTRASKNQVLQTALNSFTVHTSAAPIKNQANTAIIELLAKHFKIKKSQISLKTGHRTNRKIFEITAK